MTASDQSAHPMNDAAPPSSSGIPLDPATPEVAPSAPAPIVPWATPAPPTPAGTEMVLDLWAPGDVGVISFLLGFPAGLALAARNSIRLGRSMRAGIYLLAGGLALVTLFVLPANARALAGAANIGIALYLSWQTGKDRDRAQQSGHAVMRAGVGAGLVTAIGGWLILVPAFVVAVGILAVDEYAATPTGSADVGALPTPRPAASAASVASSPPQISFDTRPSDDTDLEALLPHQVGGRPLQSESYRGLNLFKGVFGMTDSDVAGVDAELKTRGLTIDDVSVAVAGRSSADDPPYLVNALRFRGIKAADFERRLGVTLGQFLLDAPSAGTFSPVTIAGKTVQRGTIEMVDQSEHARGIPYIYMSGDAMFAVVTDDPAWAAEAIGRLP